MFVPIHDGVRLIYLRRPAANWSLIGINVAVWLAASLGVFGNLQRLDLAFGTIPSVVLGHASLAPELMRIPAPWTLLTGMFLHGGFLHLAGNMLFLWVFGDNVEDAMGSARYVVFYLVCGLAGALLYCFVVPQSDAPLIGASGAISGVVASYLLLYPRAGVFGLVLSIIPLRVPALVVVGIWIVYQLAAALLGGSSAVAWWAHVGGLGAGAILTPLMKRSEVPLWSNRRA